MYTFGIVQFSPTNDVDKNVSTLVSLLEKQKNALFLLPELFLCDYFKQAFLTPLELKEKMKPLTELSKTNGLSIAGSLALKKRKNRYNRFVYLEEGNLQITDYSKQRLFEQEKSVFSSGAKDIGFISYRGLNIATKICFDIINPVSLSRACSKQSIDLFLVSASVSVDYLLSITRARSLENQAISLFANRSRNFDSEIKFLGKSAIYYPDGTSKLTDEKHHGLIKVDVSDKELKQIRKNRKFLGIYG